jgi:hypothetical protein
MALTVGEKHLPDDVDAPAEPLQTEPWEKLCKDDQERVVQLLARVIHKAVLANRDNAPTNFSDEIPIDSHT